jgi:AAA domain-containing protein
MRSAFSAACAGPSSCTGGLSRRTGPGHQVRLDPPEIQRLGDEIAFSWPGHGVTLSFAQLREGSDGIHGEVSVVSGVLGEVHWGRLNLASTPAREGLVKKLDQVVPGLPWRPMLERACRRTVQELRTGEPAAPLVPRLADDTARYILPKLLLAGETNLIFADGGSGKSLLALAVALAVAGKAALPNGLRPIDARPVLIADWESTRTEHEDREARLQDGMDVSGPLPILYRPMSRALADDAVTLRSEISRHHIGLVVVDSLAPACGAEPDVADALVRAFNALRSFGTVTRLVLAHMSKAAIEAKGIAKPYGSVFAFNLSRNIWQLQRAEGDDGAAEMVIAAYHRKSNAGPLLPPMGFRFQFGERMTTLHAHDIGQAPDLAARASLAFQIQKALTGGAKTAAELAEAIDAREGSVAAKLRDLKSKGKVIRLDSGPDGRGRWGLHL